MIKHGVYDHVEGAFQFGDECEGLSEEAIENYYRYPRESAGSGDEANPDEEDTPEGSLEDPASQENDLDDKNDQEYHMDASDFDNDSDLDPIDFHDLDNNFDMHLAAMDEAEVEDGTEEDCRLDAAQDVDPNIHHKPVDVPDGKCPFTREELVNLDACIAHVRQLGYLPHGYGVLQEEWEDGVYPEVEELPIGQAQRTKFIHLPSHVWLPRAVLWTQALCVLQTSEILAK